MVRKTTRKIREIRQLVIYVKGFRDQIGICLIKFFVGKTFELVIEETNFIGTSGFPIGTLRFGRKLRAKFIIVLSVLQVFTFSIIACLKYAN